MTANAETVIMTVAARARRLKNLSRIVCLAALFVGSFAGIQHIWWLVAVNAALVIANLVIYQTNDTIINNERLRGRI